MNRTGLKLGQRWFDPTIVNVKGVKRVSDLPGAPDKVTALRVVHKGHKAHPDALKGLCRPWGVIPSDGVTVERQMALTSGTRPDTGLTCWSTDADYTMRLAQSGDVILVVQVPASQAYIPFNAYQGESEVHLHGEIRGAKVIVKR